MEIENLVTVSIPITVDNLPKGIWWEDDGAAWAAELDPNDAKGWRNAPRNWKAFAKGEPTGEMYPHLPYGFNAKGGE